MTKSGETSASIAMWARQTFGLHHTLALLATRANTEMAELLFEATGDASFRKMRDEIADVVICLARISHLCGGDLWADVEAKMRINRARKWKVDANGCGQHVKPAPVKRRARVR